MFCNWQDEKKDDLRLGRGFFLSSLGGGLASDWSEEKARSLYRARQPQRAAEARVKLSARKGRRQKRLNFNLTYDTVDAISANLRIVCYSIEAVLD